MPARFVYLPVVSEALPADEALSATLDVYGSPLADLGGVRIAEDALDVPGPLLWLVATGGSERTLLRLVAERARHAPGEPVLLLAHPSHNSLPASLEALARLCREGRDGRVIYLDAENPARIRDDLEAALAAAERPDGRMACQDPARRRGGPEAATVPAAWPVQPLAGLRLGLLGAPSDWLVAGVEDPEIVTRTWGPEIVSVAMDEVRAAIGRVSPAEAERGADDLIARARAVREPSRRELADAARVRIALERLAAERRLDALTLRCFDLVTDLRVTGCAALAALCDAGTVAACEGDLASAVGMLWARRLLDVMPWMANPSRLDRADNRLLLAHCTVPTRLVEHHTLRSHFESGLGVGLQGVWAPGPVTLLRVGGRRLDRIWLAEGELLRSGDAEDLCRTQAEIRLDRGRVDDLLAAPLGNHLVLVPGRQKNRLLESWKTLRDGA